MDQTATVVLGSHSIDCNWNALQPVALAATDDDGGNAALQSDIS